MLWLTLLGSINLRYEVVLVVLLALVIVVTELGIAMEIFAGNDLVSSR
jgi:hypothetical protein